MILKAILSLTYSLSAHALETDQFNAGFHVIRESSAPINEYVEDKFRVAIEAANSKRIESTCQEVADDVLTGVVGKFSISKISQFAKKSPLIDRYPDDSVKGKSHLKQSIYKEAGFPFQLANIQLVQISRTINVGGVYIGTDKLGHFALVGRNYYRRYQKNLSQGMSREEAKKAAVMTGVKQEIHILGYTLGGVLSYGDLEANYQGMLFGISMCEGEKPYLIKKDGVWKQNPDRVFDIKNYINPKMDESYLPSFWRADLWRKVSKEIRKSYCELKDEPIYQERVKFYDSIIKTNQNDDYLAEFFKYRPKFDRKKQPIEALCE